VFFTAGFTVLASGVLAAVAGWPPGGNEETGARQGSSDREPEVRSCSSRALTSEGIHGPRNDLDEVE
jgi:hypothetical protein